MFRFLCTNVHTKIKNVHIHKNVHKLKGNDDIFILAFHI